MKFIRFYSLFSALLCFFCIEKSQAINIDTTNINIHSSNKNIRIQSLNKLANYNFSILNKNDVADSLAYIAYIEANLIGNSDIIYQSIIQYCSVADIEKQKIRAFEYIEEAEQIAKKKNDQSKLIEAVFAHTQLLIRAQDYKNAQDVLLQTDNIIVNNKKWRITYNLLLGEIFEMKLSKVYAYKSYTNAKYLAVDIENDSLLVECYRKLYKFYSKNNEQQKAIDYYDAAKKIIYNNKQFTAYDKTFFKWELVQIYRNTKQFELAIPLAYEVINDAKQLKYDLAKNYCTSSLRAVLLDNNNLNELYNFYIIKYPDELEKLKSNQPVAYCRIKSMIFEFKQNIDSSLYYFNLAEQSVIQSNNNDYKAYFFKRKGEYFLRNGNIANALGCYEKSVEFGQHAIDLSFVIEGSQKLDSLYAIQHNFEKAFQYLKLNKQYADSNNAINQNDKMAFAEVNHKLELDKLLSLKQEQKKQKEHTLQISFIILLITFLLVLLIVISNSSISLWVIKFHGYLTFIFLFEFIIYMLEIVYHNLTHREEENPIELMIVKSILVAILLPLHHWSEKQVVHFLLNHKMTTRIRIILQQIKSKFGKNST